MSGRKKKRTGRLLVFATVALVAIAISLAAVGIGPQTTSVAANGSGLISIDAHDVQPGKVRFFSYRDDAGARIRFILTRDQAGLVRGAFDACQRCYNFHKGYTTHDGYLICRLCGNRYKVEDKNLGVASCTPVSLPVQTSGSAIQIKTEDLEHSRSMF
jgi:uncharacterized membrane protein